MIKTNEQKLRTELIQQYSKYIVENSQDDNALTFFMMNNIIENDKKIAENEQIKRY